ncbi:MAG: deoxyguanosinetriphosphate triphosphohydrolase [Clostridia bacterium]|nr:deoxyguanosinetriphosphate triphosphohydrolase [Clostridia bacterium]
MRENTERFEREFLFPWAAKSYESKGREKEEEDCELRTSFQRDRDRIIYCKSFRRLKHKTQVFLAPSGDHYRTRLTHTLEVSQIARTIARSLRLNEDLTEAIAMGHDLGHTPFGHAGERVLDEICSCGFKHNEQSRRVVELLEEDKGLNLTWEVRDGIENHTSRSKPATLEGMIVSYADRIAYINHDIDDACRAGIITDADLPLRANMILGTKNSQRIDTLVKDIIKNSFGKPEVKMSDEIYEVMNELRDFMFAYVYSSDSSAKAEELKAENVVRNLFNAYMNDDSLLAPSVKADIKKYGREKAVCDYIAGMSDGYALNEYSRIFVPRSWDKE